MSRCKCMNQIDLGDELYEVEGDAIHTRIGCFHRSLFDARAPSASLRDPPRTTGGSTLPGAMKPEMVHARSVAIALDRIRAGEPVAQVEEDYGFPGGMLADAPGPCACSLRDPRAEARADHDLAPVAVEAMIRAQVIEECLRVVEAAVSEEGLLNSDDAILAPGDLFDRIRSLSTPSPAPDAEKET